MKKYKIMSPEEQTLYEKYIEELEMAESRHKYQRRQRAKKLLFLSIFSFIIGIAGIIIAKITDSMWSLLPIGVGFLAAILVFIPAAIKALFQSTEAQIIEINQLHMAYENAKMMQALKNQAKAEVMEEMKEGR